MSRLSLLLKACLGLTFVALAIPAFADDLPPNLVNNPSFEQPVEGELPPGWGGFYPNPAGAYRTTIGEGGRTGKKQMRIEFVPGSGEGQFGALPANRVPLVRSKRYVSRGWVKVAGGERATADVKLHYYGAAGEYIGQTRIGYATPGSDDWQLVTVTDRADEFPEAKFIGLAIACTGDAQAQYDDLELLAFDKKTLPANFDETYGVTLSPQLAVLARRAGSWDTKLRFKPSRWFPDGLETSSVETIGWVVGGQLLQSRQVDPQIGIEQLSLMTYDARDKVYRSWFFGVNGNLPRSQSVGKWNAETETLTFTMEEKDEFQSVFHVKFRGSDQVQMQGVWKDKEGNILLDIEGFSVRKDARKESLPDREPPPGAESSREAPPIPRIAEPKGR